MREPVIRHRFRCSQHGEFTVVAPRGCPLRGTCPECEELPTWFNTDIDAGPYGELGAPILGCCGPCAADVPS